MKEFEHPFLRNYPFYRVVAAYPGWLNRVYCRIRAHILRERILREIGQYVPDTGNIAELGCGFGLFSICMAMTRPEAQFQSCDLSAGRIAEAKAVADKLQVTNVRFHAADATTFVHTLAECDAIYMFDLIHHLPPEQVEAFVADIWRKIKPGGRLIIKDVNNHPWHKMAFTWILDVLMTRGELPHYLSEAAFLELLLPHSSEVTIHVLDDYLPYPHVLYVLHKA